MSFVSTEILEQRIKDSNFLGQLKIVSVDDDLYALKVLFGLLCSLGIRQVVEFDKPQDALIYILQSPPDIIITDNMMPGLSGVEMTKIIRAQPQPIFKNIPIIMATCAGDFFHIDQARRVGFTSILAKPFSPTELKSKIQAELKNIPAIATK